MKRFVSSMLMVVALACGMHQAIAESPPTLDEVHPTLHWVGCGISKKAYLVALSRAYGHKTGDTVLELIGESIKNEIRQSDQPVRYGGDEFVVILPDAGPEVVDMMAERIQQSISQARCNAESGESLSVTVTVGYATHSQATPFHCLEFLCHAADQELYKAKKARNQVAAAH